MKRLILVVVLSLGLADPVHATCSPTPNLGLDDCALGTPRSVVDPAWVANFLKLDFNFVTPLSRSGADINLGTVPEAKGGTNQTTYATGDTLHATAANTLGKLSPNVTTTMKYRCQQGNGSAITTDSWCSVTGADLAGTIVDNLTDLDAALCSPGESFIETGGTAWGCQLLPPPSFGSSPGSKTVTTALSSDPDDATPACWTTGGSLGECAGGGGGGGGIAEMYFLSGTGTNSVSSTVYFAVNGLSVPSGTETDVPMRSPAGRWKDLRCHIDTTSSPGDDISVAFRLNGVTQWSISCNTTNECSTEAFYADAAEGDIVNLAAVPFGSPSATPIQCSIGFIPS